MDDRDEKENTWFGFPDETFLGTVFGVVLWGGLFLGLLTLGALVWEMPGLLLIPLSVFALFGIVHGLRAVVRRFRGR